MSRNSSLVFLVCLPDGPSNAFAQLTPPPDPPVPAIRRFQACRSAPATPCALRSERHSATPRVIPPLTPNRPGAGRSPTLGRLASAPRPRCHVALCGLLTADISAYQTNPRHPPVRRRGRSQVKATFTGILPGLASPIKDGTIYRPILRATKPPCGGLLLWQADPIEPPVFGGTVLSLVDIRMPNSFQCE